MTDKSNPTLLKARQRHSRIFAIGLVLVLLVSKPMFASSELPRTIMLWAGYALVIIGTFGRVFCSTFIGGRKNDEVVRSGPFGIVRNPLYVFSFIAMTGIALQSGMVILLIILIAVFTLYYPLVVDKEEAFLAHKFGESYEAYRREVPRWVPNFKLWNEPEQMDAKPKFIRHTILDAVIFFLPLPIFSLIDTFQSLGYLPVWLTLP